VRPLRLRLPDGRVYVVPTPKPNRPRYTPAVLPPAPWPDRHEDAPQTASGQPAQPEPAPSKRRRKLSDDTVREIRADYAAGRWNQAELAYIHSVSKNLISRIVRYLDYANVKPTPDEQES
jgi:hypothetical protein